MEWCSSKKWVLLGHSWFLLACFQIVFWYFCESIVGATIAWFPYGSEYSWRAGPDIPRQILSFCDWLQDTNILIILQCSHTVSSLQQDLEPLVVCLRTAWLPVLLGPEAISARSPGSSERGAGQSDQHWSICWLVSPWYTEGEVTCVIRFMSVPGFQEQPLTVTVWLNSWLLSLYSQDCDWQSCH